jgi:hypothetical protein
MESKGKVVMSKSSVDFSMVIDKIVNSYDSNTHVVKLHGMVTAGTAKVGDEVSVFDAYGNSGSNSVYGRAKIVGISIQSHRKRVELEPNLLATVELLSQNPPPTKTPFLIKK